MILEKKCFSCPVSFSERHLVYCVRQIGSEQSASSPRGSLLPSGLKAYYFILTFAYLVKHYHLCLLNKSKYTLLEVTKESVMTT